MRSWQQAVLATVVAGVVAHLPEHAGLSEPGRHTLFILLLATGLWVSEGIPACAVALVVIALEIVLLAVPVAANLGGAWAR